MPNSLSASNASLLWFVITVGPLKLMDVAIGVEHNMTLTEKETPIGVLGLNIFKHFF